MADRQMREQLLARGEVVGGPAERACTDQSFELPSGIYVAMASMFALFIAVLAATFRGGHMAVVASVIFAFIVAFFAIPAIFSATAIGKSETRALRWMEFRQSGIATATGHSSAREATILVLLLPFLILCFAIAIVSIAAAIS
jgi:hypothetical protein